MVDNLLSHSSRSNLTEWLSYLENLHHVEIDLGLARIQEVANLLDIHFDFAKVITVAGTNGKGTTCAFLENALLGEGQSVAVYSSPHIERFNERLRIDHQDIDDNSLVQAFEQIEKTRGNISLSYYEYTTLAAFLILMIKKPDIILLEVGLGGRLDATNIIDCDVAVITTIDLDHQAFLGNDRETIAIEKAGIIRANGHVVVGDIDPPKSLLAYIDKLDAHLVCRNQDFTMSRCNDRWQWQLAEHIFTDLHLPHIPIDNVATALAVLVLLNISLERDKINQVIDKTRVAGRAELFNRHCDVILDVGHNPQAARYLAEQLSKMKYRKIYAVVGMLADKDISNVIKPLAPYIDNWYFGTLGVQRAASANELAGKVSEFSKEFICFDNVTQAFNIASEKATKHDLVLVFGSFFTVAEIRRLLI
ncbi:MAG: dihydrofolate synthase/folylpolyglutamate synthase [Alteromonadaceae bacterium]|jgi:dihydrofolate synthase/folylpolyglutamate synthase